VSYVKITMRPKRLVPPRRSSAITVNGFGNKLSTRRDYAPRYKEGVKSS
jgi:hypothetical protein